MSLQKNMLTLDVEDWEHANFSQLSDQRTQIATLVRERRYAMDRNIDLWIEMLGRHGARSTCFVLGEFADRWPIAVRRLADAGHEIASHSMTHDLIYEMTQARFREQLERALGTLGELTGVKPLGFRAPSWSVDPIRTPWFCEELARQGIRYDSSEFPVRTGLFGRGDSPLRPYWHDGIFRVPVTVLKFGPLRLPFSSGAFFRLSPAWLIRCGLRRASRQDYPVMVVLHPRELDAAHPRLPLKGWERSVHYARLHTTLPKLESILQAFQWHSVHAAIEAELKAGNGGRT